MRDAEGIEAHQAIYQHFLDNVELSDRWSGRHGGNCFGLWRAILERLQGIEKLKIRGTKIRFTASVRELSKWSGISSFDTIYRCMTTLGEMGLIETLDRGTPDQYHRDAGGRVTHREEGRPAIYAVRLSERSIQASTNTSQPAGEVVERDSDNQWQIGSFRLPNSEFVGSDLVRSEPHLLRMLDLMVLWGESSIRLTARVIAKRLGLAVSSCHQLLQRWREKGLVYGLKNTLNRKRPEWISNSRNKVNRIMERCFRDETRRREGLAGRWKKKSMCVFQRLVFKVDDDGHHMVDWPWSTEIKRAQERGIGWLDPGEMLRAWLDSREGDLARVGT